MQENAKRVKKRQIDIGKGRQRKPERQAETEVRRGKQRQVEVGKGRRRQAEAGRITEVSANGREQRHLLTFRKDFFHLEASNFPRGS